MRTLILAALALQSIAIAQTATPVNPNYTCGTSHQPCPMLADPARHALATGERAVCEIGGMWNRLPVGQPCRPTELQASRICTIEGRFCGPNEGSMIDPSTGKVIPENRIAEPEKYIGLDTDGNYVYEREPFDRTRKKAPAPSTDKPDYVDFKTSLHDEGGWVWDVREYKADNWFGGSLSWYGQNHKLWAQLHRKESPNVYPVTNISGGLSLTVEASSECTLTAKETEFTLTCAAPKKEAKP